MLTLFKLLMLALAALFLFIAYLTGRIFLDRYRDGDRRAGLIGVCAIALMLLATVNMLNNFF